MEEEELKYNTQRKKLILPEYGRNIHIHGKLPFNHQGSGGKNQSSQNGN